MAKRYSLADGGFAAVSSQFLNKYHKATAVPITAITPFLAEFLRWF